MACAYIIVDMKISDPEQYKQYMADAPAAVKAHGGEYLVRGGVHEVLEGGWQPARIAMLRFTAWPQPRLFTTPSCTVPPAPSVPARPNFSTWSWSRACQRLWFDSGGLTRCGSETRPKAVRVCSGHTPHAHRMLQDEYKRVKPASPPQTNLQRRVGWSSGCWRALACWPSNPAWAGRAASPEALSRWCPKPAASRPTAYAATRQKSSGSSTPRASRPARGGAMAMALQQAQTRPLHAGAASHPPPVFGRHAIALLHLQAVPG